MEQTKSNTISIVLAVIITAVVIVGGMYWWQAQNSTKTTYQNNRHLFSFDYNSEEYSVAESRSRGGSTGDESDLIRITAKDESCPAVDIFLSTATLEEELNDLELRISGDTVQTTVDGIPATKRSGKITDHVPPCGSEKTEIVFENDVSVFVITAFKNSESSLDELLESLDIWSLPTILDTYTDKNSIF